jgi:hypothetical protein
MIVKAKTNFVGEAVFDMEAPTLKKVVAELSDKVGFPICSPENGDIQGDFKVYLNGVEYDSLGNGNNIALKENDQVEVTIVILAGG